MSFTGKQKAKTAARYDTSQLTESGRGHLVHRDYAAHFFRWGWATRFSRRDAFVLDIGCGRDTPMARVLKAFPSTCPDLYVGVDYQKIDAPAGNFWVTPLGEFDFVERWREIAESMREDYKGRLFDLIVSFESIEHMSRKDGLKLLTGARALLAPAGTFLISTPVFDGKRMAAAHIHEWKADELRDALDDAGFRVVRRHGTFASAHDIRRVATPAHLEVYDRLCEFYSFDVAALFLAPMYPDAARNCAWVCEAK